MRVFVRSLQITAGVLAALMVAALLGHLMLTPQSGELLVLASARQADHVGPGSVEVHSAAFWLTLGSFNSRAIPVAPDTATLIDARPPVATYDALRIIGRTTTRCGS